MEKFKIGDKVVHHDSKGKYISTGIITGIKYTSPLGNIYKVDVLYSDIKASGSLNKNINQRFLKKIK